MNKTHDIIQIQNINKDNTTEKENIDKNDHIDLFQEAYKIEGKITNGVAINLVCNYCHGPLLGKPRILKFADLERFFAAILVKQIIVKNIREE